MLRIVRDEKGNHSVDGKPFQPPGLLKYRKKTLTKAVRMLEPFSVETLEGTMEGKAGDWLLIGAGDEMYPCDADIFAKTFELAEGQLDPDMMKMLSAPCWTFLGEEVETEPLAEHSGD